MIQLDRIEDKIECVEADSIEALEQKINEKIDMNEALLLRVHSVSHFVHIDPLRGQPIYSATIHFRAKQS